MKPNIGVIEGFFGPAWSWTDRQFVADSLSQEVKRQKQNSFYIYAPKSDPYLRKKWREDHPVEIWQQLRTLSDNFRQAGVSFGVGLSPFELTSTDSEKLKEKIEKLNALNLDYLGLFFDDMKSSNDLAAKQVAACKSILRETDAKILFCPSYYSFDPILDKVFGDRPANYLETLGVEIPKEIDLMWTGEKVLSDAISPSHLQEVAQLLRRKPFIWDNYFANDGPKQCQFLKIKPVYGRSMESLEHSSGWAINPMNQCHLSILAVSIFIKTIFGTPPDGAYKKILNSSQPDTFAKLLSDTLPNFNQMGRNQLSEKEKNQFTRHFKKYDTPVAKEISAWLCGDYIVDNECLTD